MKYYYNNVKVYGFKTLMIQMIYLVNIIISIIIITHTTKNLLCRNIKGCRNESFKWSSCRRIYYILYTSHTMLQTLTVAHKIDDFC